MPQRDGPRLEGRNGQIWRRYVQGQTQARIGEELGLSQQRVSEVIAEVREAIPAEVRSDAALLAVERADALLAAVWPEAMAGDHRAVMAALRVLERQSRLLGLDAAEPLRVALERRLDDDSQLVVDAVAAALDVLGLDEEQQARAVVAATARLAGEDSSGREGHFSG
jgi:hypothetical protein